MKRLMIFALIAGTSGVLCTAADAPPKAARTGAQKVTGDEIASVWTASKAKRAAVFKELDANGDGVLTKNEVNNNPAFDKLDLNHDGKITLPEYNIALAGVVGTTVDKTDTNGDGTVTKQEVIDTVKARRAARQAGK